MLSRTSFRHTAETSRVTYYSDLIVAINTQTSLKYAVRQLTNGSCISSVNFTPPLQLMVQAQSQSTSYDADKLLIPLKLTSPTPLGLRLSVAYRATLKLGNNAALCI